MHKPLICISGGHLTPAIALIEKIQGYHPDWRIIFIGRNKPLEGVQVRSEEQRIIRNYDIPFLPLTTGRWRGWIDLETVGSLFRIPIGFLQAVFILWNYRPDMIISFGGYVALPVTLAGFLLGIAVITHEQTPMPGLSNRIIFKFARRICISNRVTGYVFPEQKTVYTGLPIRSDIFHPPIKSSISLNMSLPLLYISGGATGSDSVNKLIYPIVSKLVKKFTIIHQVGRPWIRYARIKRQKLRSDVRSRYQVVAYLDGSEHSYVLNRAKLIIGRSGANTVGEIAALGKVALFIPLPWSRGKEQYLNAQMLAEAGSAVILDQNNSTSAILLTEIEKILSSYSVKKLAARRFAENFPKDAAGRLMAEMEKLL